MKDRTIHLGFEIGSGASVEVPLRHMAVTGQTQQSGKTTTLEALIERSGATSLTFVTKRGEASFASGRRIQPYFRDRADWQFVTSLLDATLQEKNKFLRPWIIKICRTTETLADVQDAVRDALTTAKGINAGVYTQLDAYLELIVPEIERAELADTLDLQPGLNVMDVSGFDTPMQMLFIQSALDWVNECCTHTTVVIPEAWEFLPQSKSSPVKASAETLIRKGAGLGNHIWLDSQDMAGVDNLALRACTVWLIGVQREANEIKRALDNIPANLQRPKAADVATLERGQFFACFGKTVAKVYVQPAWMHEFDARQVATGRVSAETVARERIPPPAPKPAPASAPQPEPEEEPMSKEVEKKLDEMIGLLKAFVTKGAAAQAGVAAAVRSAEAPRAQTAVLPAGEEEDALYARFLARLKLDAPVIIQVLAKVPELEIQETRENIQVDGTSIRGRIARLIVDGWFASAKTGYSVFQELCRTGAGIAKPSAYKECDKLVELGFLTKEGSDGYQAAPNAKSRIKKV